jgi:hypothetical protein
MRPHARAGNPNALYSSHPARAVCAQVQPRRAVKCRTRRLGCNDFIEENLEKTRC